MKRVPIIPRAGQLCRSRRVLHLANCVAVLLMAACAEQSVPSAPRTSWSAGAASSWEEAAALERSAAEQDDILTADVRFLRFENKFPGFGGFFIDSVGAYVIWAPAGTSIDAARQALLDYKSDIGLPEDIQEQLQSGHTLRVLPTDIPFSYLVAWKMAFAVQRMGGEGIVSIDADEAHNQLAVGVGDTASIDRARDLAIEAGIPLNNVRITVGGIAAITDSWPDLLLSANTSLANLQDSALVKVGGIQIQSGAGNDCTLGFNVLQESGNLVFSNGILTASHCAVAPHVTPGGHAGNVIYQNVATTSKRVGVVAIDPPWGLTGGRCRASFVCALADVMYVRYDYSNTPQRARKIATEVATGSPAWTGATQPVGAYNTSFAPVGTAVYKVGRSTGRLSGVIDATCEIVDNTTDSTTVVCAERVNGGTPTGGDSGSPTYSLSGSVVRAEGITFASRVNGVGWWFSSWNMLQLWLAKPFNPVY